jgi:hypothetical protein
MTRRSGRPDERAISEATGVAILLVLTVLVTASVGVGVLFLSEEGEADVITNFSFNHQSDQSVMLVSPAEGGTLPAGEIVLEGPPGAVTWAELAGVQPNTSIGPSSPPIQLSEGSAWGSDVTTAQTVEIYWVPEADNRTRLDHWPASP